MSKFKRVSLAGSEELFRPTRPHVVEETDGTISELVDRPPAQRPPHKLMSLTQAYPSAPPPLSSMNSTPALSKARLSAVATGSVDCLGCTNVQMTGSLAERLSLQYRVHAPYFGRTRFAALAPHIEEANRCNTNVIINRQIAPRG